MSDQVEHVGMVREKDRDVWHADCACGWWFDYSAPELALDAVEDHVERHTGDIPATAMELIHHGTPDEAAAARARTVRGMIADEAGVFGADDDARQLRRIAANLITVHQWQRGAMVLYAIADSIDGGYGHD